MNHLYGHKFGSMDDRRADHRIPINKHAFIKIEERQMDGIVLNQSKGGACLLCRELAGDSIRPSQVILFSWTVEAVENDKFKVSYTLKGEVIWFLQESGVMGIRLIR